MTKLLARIAELEGIEAGATEGPWFQGYWSGQCHRKHTHGIGNCRYEYTRRIGDGYRETQIGTAIENMSLIVGNEGELAPKNAKFIVEARNTFLPLLSCLREAVEALGEIGKPVDLDNSLLDRPIENMSLANAALAFISRKIGAGEEG